MGWLGGDADAQAGVALRWPAGSPSPMKKSRLALADVEPDTEPDPKPIDKNKGKGKGDKDKTDHMMTDMQKSLRKIGAYQTILLKQKMTIKRTTVSAGIASIVKDRYSEGEGLRKNFAKILARGKSAITGAIYKQTMKEFQQYEQKAKKEMSQAKPFCR